MEQNKKAFPLDRSETFKFSQSKCWALVDLIKLRCPLCYHDEFHRIQIYAINFLQILFIVSPQQIFVDLPSHCEINKHQQLLKFDLSCKIVDDLEIIQKIQ